MNELIKIETQTLNNEQVNTVNARELHEFLGSQRQFADWIKARLEKYNFVENVDYICISQNCETQRATGQKGISVRKEYYVTVDVAKELSMLENNEKGREARRYFIECEKKLKETLSPKQQFLLDILDSKDDLSRAVAINKYEIGYVRPLEEELSKQRITNGHLALEVVKHGVKAAYYDDVLATPDLLTVTDIANDYGFSARSLNMFLEEKGIQYKSRGHWRLYAKYTKMGLAKTYTHICTCSEFTDHCTLTLKWTQKGREFIHQLLKEEGIVE